MPARPFTAAGEKAGEAPASQGRTAAPDPLSDDDPYDAIFKIFNSGK